MVHKKSAQVRSSFFGSNSSSNRPPAAISQPKKSSPDYINLGGNGNSGFLSAAAAMLENSLFIRARANQDLAKKLLEYHSTYFEQ
ncbi:MAG: hypothetical protein H0U70_06860 [Tatlockia sp.]|nr:hypothetical protein [Tatlockia sp.]